MNAEAVRGAVGMASLVVRAADTSVAQALNDLPVLSSPTLMTVIEGACTAALAEHMEPSDTTVTSEINIVSQSTAGVGTEIIANATCVDIVEKDFVFDVSVHNASKVVAAGTVTRRLVDRVSYAARVAAESMIGEAHIN